MMSLEASDVPSDEDCEELVEESFRFSDDFLEKKTSRKRVSKPPPSPKSPYLTSLNVNPRKAAVAAWRLPRASLGGSREGNPGETAPAHPASLSNGHGLSQMIRTEYNVSPEIIKNTFTSKKQHRLHSAATGFTYTVTDFRDKEDMYEEILRLKKSLQAHKSDNHQLKAKLRRLEEDNAKREKQIEELLDPTKGPDYARSLVDKKKEGSVVVNGLKQRILKLEQQCREKENALSKLQSELRTTNLEEQRITLEMYFEEIQRLKTLLDAAEKSSRAESKCSQRQQRALSSRVRDLTENVRQLQQENSQLREELSTDSPAGGLRGYREWGKQRLLRRLLELEMRLEDHRRHTQREKICARLDQEVQTAANDSTDGMKPLTMATEAMVSVETMTEGGDEACELRERLSQSKEEGVVLKETLWNREDELVKIRTEKESLEKEMEKWKDKQTSERELEMELLWTKIQTLEEVKDRAALTDHLNLTEPNPERPKDRGEDSGQRQESGDKRGRGRERAARLIQRTWREHRDRDVLLLQSAFRGHLHREALLKAAIETKGLLDTQALIMVQSAFRGHLYRSGTAIDISGSSSVVKCSVDTQRRLHSPNIPPPPPAQADSCEAAAGDSDDSDDIIVSPSRPIRRREVLIM